MRSKNVYVEQISDYTNPKTGKGWTDREEAIIADIMATESMLAYGNSEDSTHPATRMEAIRRMRRRGLDDLKGKIRILRTSVDAPARYCANDQNSVHLLPPNKEDRLTSGKSGLVYCGIECLSEHCPPAAPEITIRPEVQMESAAEEIISERGLQQLESTETQIGVELTDENSPNLALETKDLDAADLSVNSLEPFSVVSTYLEASEPQSAIVDVLLAAKPREVKRRGRPRRWKDDRERKQAERARFKPSVSAFGKSSSEDESDSKESYKSVEEPADKPLRARQLRKSPLRRTYHIPEFVKLSKIAEQNNRCIYCDREFGTAAMKDGILEILRPEPDHLDPRAAGGKTKDANIHYACHLCNSLKSDFLFDGIDDARVFLAEAWARKNYTTAPLLIPFSRSKDLAISYN